MRLAKRILPRDVWTFHGLRPTNRPERRLALAACWLSRPDFVPWLDDWVCQTETRPTPAAALLGHLTASDEYWSTHWTFRSGRFPKAQPLLGAGRLHDIAVNVILPWLYARASADDNTGLRQRVVERYFAWPKGQDNSRLRFVRQRLLGVRRISLRGAAAQQGLLQVQADFCNRTNALCDDCVFSRSRASAFARKKIKKAFAKAGNFGRLRLRFSGSGCSSVGRASPCQGDCREFESLHPLHFFKNPFVSCKGLFCIQLTS